MAIGVGCRAPEFCLKSKRGEGVVDVRLGDFLGRQHVVLLFFPLAFTGVCTQELCDVSAGLKVYEGLDAAVVGVSVDSPFAQEAWALKEGIGIVLGSDLNKGVARDYGVLLDDLMGLGSVSARAAFVVDKGGVVRYSEQTASPKDLPDFGAVRSVLEGLG